MFCFYDQGKVVAARSVSLDNSWIYRGNLKSSDPFVFLFLRNTVQSVYSASLLHGILHLNCDCLLVLSLSLLDSNSLYGSFATSNIFSVSSRLIYKIHSYITNYFAVSPNRPFSQSVPKVSASKCTKSLASSLPTVGTRSVNKVFGTFNTVSYSASVLFVLRPEL